MVKGKNKIQIKDVLLGDILENNEKVLSVYRFLANGQKMVLLNGIEVSTNHFVKYNNIYIEAKDHPNAIPIPSWSGGSLRPLICLDTDNHTIPINNTIFSDWDETNEIDSKLMIQNENLLNNTIADTSSTNKYKWIFQPALSSSIKVLYKDGSLVSCEDIKLGDEISMGRVVGIGKRLVYEWSELPSGLIVTPSTLFWNKNKWIRAGKISEVIHSTTPSVFYSFVVLGTASIELSSKEIVRDMCEIHSPDNDNLIRAWFRPESLYYSSSG